MSIKIQVPELKGYKVIKDSKLSQLVDESVNKNWWNDEGWSSMYEMSYQELIDSLKSGDFLTQNRGLANSLDIKASEFDEDIDDGTQERLKQVFDFLEKKENKSNPTRDKTQDPELKSFLKDDVIVVGKKGFSIFDKTSSKMDPNILIYPYPTDGLISEYQGQEEPFIIDILDNGVFVVRTIEDLLKIYPSKGIPERVGAKDIYVI